MPQPIFPQGRQPVDPDTDAKQRIYSTVAQILIEAMRKLSTNPGALSQILYNIMRGMTAVNNNPQSNYYQQGNI